MVPCIELVARRRPENLGEGRPDYDVFAGPVRVGRIYCTHAHSSGEGWWYGINGVMVDATVGAPIHGYVGSFDKAQAELRASFNLYLAWARCQRVI